MKRWKKRTLALMLAAGTAWGLCACGEEPASLPPAEETPSSQTSEPLVVSDGGNSEIFVPQGEETLLPNGWDLADFTQAGFDKDGPGDLGLRVPLTGEEEARLAGLLQPENWQEAQPAERGISPCLTLLDQEGGRQLVTAEDPELGTLILLREEGSDERWLYAAPKEVAGQARSLAEAIRERGGTDSGAQADNQSAQVLWPQLVPQSLGESALYKEALARPSAILYQGQPVTSREAVDRFIQSADQGEKEENSGSIPSGSWTEASAAPASTSVPTAGRPGPGRTAGRGLWRRGRPIRWSRSPSPTTAISPGSRTGAANPSAGRW